MIKALLRKDLRLLGTYIWAAAWVTMACYVVSAIMIVWMTNYMDQSEQSWLVRTYFTLSAGSMFGLCITLFFAVLIAGSALTLERGDRSVEFLACLPPTRWQHLQSKLIVMFATSAILVLVHYSTSLVSSYLSSWARELSMQAATSPESPKLLMIVSLLFSMTGGAFATSAWSSSNGVPILAGLLTPILMMATISLLGYWLDIPMEGEQFAYRYQTGSVLFGIFLISCGCYWYLQRVNP